MKSSVVWGLLLLLIPLCSEADLKDPQVATLVQAEGPVQIYHHPSEKLPSQEDRLEGALALYEGLYYRVAQAKAGDRIEKGNVVRTLPGARARIIYDNGDQFYLGTATAYRVTWKDEGASLAKLNLMYGRLRGVISKEGPRKKLMIHTRAATMGVRGTDFYISDSGPEGMTQVSVLRGRVELENTGGAKAVLATGQSAEVQKKEEKKKIETRTLHQGDLAGIQETSSIRQESGPAEEALVQLEKKAIQVTAKDIETYQPDAFRKLPKDLTRIKTVAELNSQVVEEASRVAPPAPKKMKPRLRELQNSDGTDYYDQYFKPAK